jgi:hypothetical protein
MEKTDAINQMAQESAGGLKGGERWEHVAGYESGYKAAHKKFYRAFNELLMDPHGCKFCDSGRLRNPQKEHTDECGFGQIQKIMEDLTINERPF